MPQKPVFSFYFPSAACFMADSREALSVKVRVNLDTFELADFMLPDRA